MRLFDTHAHLSDDAFDADCHELISTVSYTHLTLPTKA